MGYRPERSWRPWFADKALVSKEPPRQCGFIMTDDGPVPMSGNVARIHD